MTKKPPSVTDLPTEVASKHDYFFLEVALALAGMGTCSRAKVGSLIVLDRRIISTGYNGVPSGFPHCEHSGDDSCKSAVHAEANAIAFAAKHGLKIQDSTLWTTLSPCYTCATLILNSGITRVRFLDQYRDPTGIDLLKGAGLTVERYIGPVVYPMQVKSGDGPSMYSRYAAPESIEARWGTLKTDSGWGGPGW